MEKYPFNYDPALSFASQISDWVSDVLYETLPEHGFEVRDEQIYMAFQLERAFAEQQTIFAEAGVGTGKTIVYLLYAICYARYKRRPAVIACADESLIEQLVKPEGDIAKLTRHLGLTIDARLGKSPDQYVCIRKLDNARYGGDEAIPFKELYDGLPEFVRNPEAMQAFYGYGDRKDYPQLNDEQWSQVGWDVFQDCFVCDRRHRCGQTLSRDHFRKSTDLIICSHDYYMEHVWTYESRKRGGQLPLLPEHSSIVFDEGHLLEEAAMKALCYKLKHAVFEEMILRLLSGEVRESLAVLIDEAIEQSELLFDIIAVQSRPITGSDRKQIVLNQLLVQEVNRFRSVLAAIEEELVFESELYSLNDYQLRVVEEHIEMLQKALMLFEHTDTLICWATDSEDGTTLSFMPRVVKEMLREYVFTSKYPIIFSSATLSVDGTFDYVANNLGVEQYLSFAVPSPYDYPQQMEAVAPQWREGGTFAEKLKTAAQLLEISGGRALILFPTKDELQLFKMLTLNQPEFADQQFLFEGDAEISHLISRFQLQESTTLCAVSLWEGLDVPGPSLSLVIIWSLPFPPLDPVFLVKRAETASPFEEVDLPYMLLRLRQGIGRLIRTSSDRGSVAILSSELFSNAKVRSSVHAVLPDGVVLSEPIYV